ncbi:MAG: hypothetical protein F6K47_29330 [Symploca sp. SIO2E6]|nr:hypothetical protein [Symploca sp. SIO2E6]
MVQWLQWRLTEAVNLGKIMNKMRRYQLSNLLLTVMLAIGLVFGRNPVASAEGCSTANMITGSYDCDVACIAREVNDGRKGFIAHGETDTITHFTLGDVTEKDEFYKVEIKSGDFHEVEIGPRLGCTLYTATESVSDNQFPVLEEYIFQEENGKVCSFTKIVRNPSRADFKTCKVECTRK